MFESLIERLIIRLKVLYKWCKTFRIRTVMLAGINIYFIFILLIQIGFGLTCLVYSRKLSDDRSIKTVSGSISQAALRIKNTLENMENFSKTISEEAGANPGKTVDMVFKMNADISGAYLYRPGGRMFSYTNRYGEYPDISGKAPDYADLLQYRDIGRAFIRRSGDNLVQYMLSINFYPDVSGGKDYTAVVLEKSWAGQRSYYEDLGLLDSGSVVLINREGEVLMSFRRENAIGDETLVRSGGIIDRLGSTSGMFTHKAYGETVYIFYDKGVGNGCALVYISGGQFFENDMQRSEYIILASGVLMILLNVSMAIVFVRNVYRPVANIEAALHAIASGGTDLTSAQIAFPGDSRYPAYNDIGLIIARFKHLIESEYMANIMKKQAEINALQSQINPHFLYNTLESIRGQAIVEEMDGIEKMVKGLADIFRYSISNKNAMVRLEEELKNIDSYLGIQQFRFNNKFAIIKNIAEDAWGYLIPKLIIQPLVENAIVHGLEMKYGKGMIKISATSTADSIVISVEDDGEGIELETLEAINESLIHGESRGNAADVKTGMGLININERVKLIFGGGNVLSIYSTPRIGTKVELRIPKSLQNREGDDASYGKKCEIR